MKHFFGKSLQIFAMHIAVTSVSICADENLSGFKQHSDSKVELGQLLFFDKILSGNKNISCATCHHPLCGTTDNLSLGIGEGGKGLGPARHLEMTESKEFDAKRRIPRNAPALFNLGHYEFRVAFHDGRVQKDRTKPSGFLTPAGDKTPEGLDSLLAAQALFPITSNHEMAGEPGSNPIADAAKALKFAGEDGVWEMLTQRIRDIPEYVGYFKEVYPKEIQSADQITIVHIANAIGEFESKTWRSDNSPFDRFTAGDSDCLSKGAKQGMQLFFGKGKCVTCHSGRFQTDQRFHSIGMPQIGPGKGDGPNKNHDFGRERVTKLEKDRFKFRTPSLRNVALTAPYGHCGAYSDLESVIKHHLNPSAALESYDPVANVRLPNTGTTTKGDVLVTSDPSAMKELAKHSEIDSLPLNDEEVSKIIDFLHCLTDPKALNMLDQVPMKVPSGLPIHD